MSANNLRMPNGVMDWLENGHTATSEAEAIAADAASQQGDPRSYERALEHQRNRAAVTRTTGKPMFTMIADALARADRKPEGGI